MADRDSVVELATELIDVMFEQEPMYPTIIGVPGPHDRLADLSEQAEHGFRQRYERLAERAAEVDPAGLAEPDRIPRAVVIQQARARIAALDSKVLEHTITDFFVATASELMSMLPIIDLTDDARA